jgi:hypothetical protein
MKEFTNSLMFKIRSLKVGQRIEHGYPMDKAGIANLRKIVSLIEKQTGHTLEYHTKTIRRIACIAFAIMLSITASAQGFIDAGLGLSARFGITAKIDAGKIWANNNYSGPMIAATGVIEGGFSANYGLLAGWQWYGIAFYAGASKIAIKNKTLSDTKSIYPIAGITYRWPQNRCNADLRYQANSIYLTLNVRIGKGHND